MSDDEIPRQGDFLYNEKWNARVDDFLVETILMKKRMLQWQGNDIPTYVIVDTHRMLNHCYKVELAISDVLERVDFLRKRYSTFKKIVPPNARTQWDYSSNKVTAHYKVWRKLFKNEPFSMAYYWNGEPLFRKLCALFGMEDEVKQEDEKTVIVISDSTEVVIEDSPSVNQHVHGIGMDAQSAMPPARRRLFQDLYRSTDAASSNVFPHASISQYPGASTDPDNSFCGSTSP